MKKYCASVHIMLIFTTFCIQGMVDNGHFWRATNFFGEPRHEKSWLSSIDVSIHGGSTSHSRNANNHSTALLNLYGPHNFHKIGEGVPDKNPSNQLDLILINLAQEPSREHFGQMIYDGDFKFTEIDMRFVQNFARGFFAELQIPFQYLSLCSFKRCDLTSNGPECPNQDNQWWQAFLENFDDILKRYCLTISCIQNGGIGDIAFLGGWTTNYEETEVLDFIDITIKTGLSIPTARKRDISNPFDIVPGYDGHYGIPLWIDTSLGLYEWLNVGCHLNTIIFLDTTKTVPMTTSLAQNGFIKLARGKAEIDRGNIWNVGTYLKADHFIGGLSLLTGYSYTQQDRTYLTPCDTTIFDSTIVNSDSTLSGFKMHVVHFVAEYDFATEHYPLRPRINFFYNLQVGGKQVFQTNNAGGLLGFDIALNF